MKQSLFLTVALLFSYPHLLAGFQRSTQSVTDPNVKSFEKVWTTIKNSHWDEKLVGESWTKNREELLPKVKAATSDAEARKIMNELISRLGQSHFGILPKASYEAVAEGEGGGHANVGITARLVEGEVVVTHVRPGSAASENNIKPGWAILKIRNREMSELIDRLSEDLHGPQRVDTTVGLVVEQMSSGQNGQDIEVTFLDANEETRVLDLKCDVPDGKMFKFGHLPPMLVIDESKTLPGNIGYYKFNAFLAPKRIMQNYQEFVRDEDHNRGLIIDLRGNIGGIAGMTMGMAGQFVKEQRTLGVMSMKGTTLNFVANPRATPITCPVAILVDECSISSAEIFAGGLQDLGIAKVFGSRTAGLALPSVVIRLPNGDGFQYAMANYHSASGKSLEKDGVTPDEDITLTRQMLLSDADPVLKAATSWVEESSN